MIEGTVVSVPLTFNGLSSEAKVDVNTRNILFICGGAFPDLEAIVAKRINQKQTIGFHSSYNSEETNDIENIFQHINTDDLIKFGMIPELIGRLPIIVAMDNLSVTALKKILVEPTNSLVNQYRSLFAYTTIDLLFKDEALEEIANIAFQKGTGARALRSILEDLLLDLMFELFQTSCIKKVIITKGFVLKSSPPIAVRKDLYSIPLVSNSI